MGIVGFQSVAVAQHHQIAIGRIVGGIAHHSFKGSHHRIACIQIQINAIMHAAPASAKPAGYGSRYRRMVVA